MPEPGLAILVCESLFLFLELLQFPLSSPGQLSEDGGEAAATYSRFCPASANLELVLSSCQGIWVWPA